MSILKASGVLSPRHPVTSCRVAQCVLTCKYKHTLHTAEPSIAETLTYLKCKPAAYILIEFLQNPA